MNILIPTRGRHDHQPTAEALTQAGISFTLVLNTEDTNPYSYKSIRVVAHNIADKRQAIVNKYGHEKMIMCDDDMRFYTRIGDRYRLSSPNELKILFKRIESELDDWVHVGTASRFMANYRSPDHEIGGRYIRLLAYHFKLMKDSKEVFNQLRYRFPGHEDHDFNMQLQTLGYIPKVLTCFAQDDHGQFNPGGCSTWRTPDSDIKQMKKFAEAWPGIVNFSEPNKKYPIGRMRISWTKLKNSKSNNVLI